MAQNFYQGLISKEVAISFPKKEDCLYTTHFCEENIWMLVKKIQEAHPDKIPYCYAVFISNHNEHIPLWRQSSSKQPDGLVVWDYHVIMIYSKDDNCLVFDFDSQLPFPSLFSVYSKETFQEDEFLNPQYHRYFRVIPAEMFLKYFASDRRHMVNDDGTWKMPPPNYLPIRNSEEIHNLPQYISMKESNCVTGKFGQIFNLNNFVSKFSSLQKSIQSFDYSNPPEPHQPNWL